MSWIVNLEENNFDIRIDSYQRTIANTMVRDNDRLYSLKKELEVEQSKLNYSEQLQKLRRGSEWSKYYFPGVTIHRSRLDQKRDKNRKERIVGLKLEVERLEVKLRGFNVPNS